MGERTISAFVNSLYKVNLLVIGDGDTETQKANLLLAAGDNLSVSFEMWLCARC